jgi:hypothetical protein
VTEQDSRDRLLITGLATVFDQPGLGGTPPWPAKAFQRFVDLSTSVPVKLDHLPIAMAYSNGQIITSVGRAFDFAIVPEASTPAGLLAMARLDEGDLGDALLAEIRRGLQPWAEQRWALSVGGKERSGPAGQLVWPLELSLTRDPAYPDALILAVGADAARVFELLAGRPPHGAHSSNIDPRRPHD